MDTQQFKDPNKLERWSFLWSEARLVIAAVALFLGGIPPIFFIFRGVSAVGSLLNICWIISGIASAYLLYRWSKVKTVFGGKETKDLATFFVSVVSGLNLGIVGVLGTNIGMSISSNKIIFFIVGIIYLISAYHLHKRWKSNGEKLF